MSLEMQGFRGDVEGGYKGGYQAPYVNGKEKLNLSELERQLIAYNSLDKSARGSVNVVTFCGFVVAFVLCRVICSEYGTMAVSMAFIFSTGGIVWALGLLAWIYRFDEGTPEMRSVADAIKEGAEGFFQVQYGTISVLAACTGTGLFLMYATKDPETMPTQAISPLSMAVLTGITFVVGALCSALSGYAGMWVSVRANVRVANAATKCYNDAIQLCFRAGLFASVVNVGLVIQGLSFSILALRTIFPAVSFAQLPLLLTGYGFGASMVAMFAQLGGGIYTKGADVGADLVGKVEQNIPEDDPRNPAVIADLVGDNVGDCAGQCADTFESIAAEIMSAMILGGSLAQAGNLHGDEAVGFVVFPLGVHCLDLFASTVGCMLVRTKRGMPGEAGYGEPEDPLSIMKKCFLVTIIIAITGFALLCRCFLCVAHAPDAWKWFAGCGAIGILCAYFFVIITQYYTDYEYNKVQSIAEASVTGAATNIIAGIAVGMESTALPVILISFSLVSAYNLGCMSGVAPKESESVAGLFGTAVATMGMLSTAAFVLTMSSFGPIADNAGGIVEMSRQEENVRVITDKLDAVGNVTKANTKGFSVGSAALACFLLFSAFLDEVTIYSKEEFKAVDIAVPEVFVGGLCGSMLVFLFSAWAMQAVGRTAQEVVIEVRKQFRERPGIMDFSEKPDYYRCVAIVAKSGLREMVKPGLLAVLSPIVIGVTFRMFGQYKGQPLLGCQVLAAFLMFATATGIMMALFLNNAGGAWDNAKKYVETGKYGGKGSDTHHAVVVGDTVGDPCKDTAGPSVHVLMKLLSTVVMVLTPLFVAPARPLDAGLAAMPR